MADLETWKTQLSQMGGKIDQAAKIFGELQDRKKAIIAGSTQFSLKDILTREQRVIEICTQGIGVAKYALFDIKVKVGWSSFKPTKAFRVLLTTLSQKLNIAEDFLKILSDDQKLWMQWQAAAEPDKKIILTRLAQTDKKMKKLLRTLGSEKSLMTPEVRGNLIQRIFHTAAPVAVAGIAMGTIYFNTTDVGQQHEAQAVMAVVAGMALIFNRIASFGSEW